MKKNKSDKPEINITGNKYNLNCNPRFHTRYLG